MGSPGDGQALPPWTTQRDPARALGADKILLSRTWEPTLKHEGAFKGVGKMEQKDRFI